MRYALDKFEVPYDLIYKERVQERQPARAYDVIVIPNQGRSGEAHGVRHRAARQADRIQEERPVQDLGMYGESDDITGGMGLEGVAEIEKFVKAGGVLVTLGQASYFPADFGIARRVDAGRTSAQFYAPGPIVEAEILRPEHPIFYGYTGKRSRCATGAVRSSASRPAPTRSSRRRRARRRCRKGMLMRYPGGDDHVLSGLMRGANEIRNRAAIVDQPSGKGRVILFAGNPCYRWQNFGEFNMLFNTVLNFNDLGAAASRTQTTTAEVRSGSGPGASGE